MKLYARPIRPIFRPARLSPGWVLLAELHRDPKSHLPSGHIIQNTHTKLFCEWNGHGGTRALPQRRVWEALEKAGIKVEAPDEFEDERDERERKELAELVKNWRAKAELSTTRAGQLLDLSPRTIEGIEQGRGFSHTRLLVLALMSFG